VAIKVKNLKRYKTLITFKDFLPNSMPLQLFRYV